MKYSINIIRLLGSFLILIFLFSFSNNRNNRRKLVKSKVEFLKGDNHFISYPMVNKLLIQNNDSLSNITKENLALNRLERVLNENQMIQEAEVYVTVSGELKAEIKQRTPIARLKERKSYYIDIEGKAMPMSSIFSARVPLVTGDLNENDLEDIYKLAYYVYKDEFLSKHVVGIHKTGHEFELMLRKKNFLLHLGTITHLPSKFRKFKAFYQKAQKDSTIEKYARINLEFDNQVVCTKR